MTTSTQNKKESDKFKDLIPQRRSPRKSADPSDIQNDSVFFKQYTSQVRVGSSEPQFYALPITEVIPSRLSIENTSF